MKTESHTQKHSRASRKKSWERLKRVLAAGPFVTCPKCGFEFLAFVHQCRRETANGNCMACGAEIPVPPTQLVYISPSYEFARRVAR